MLHKLILFLLFYLNTCNSLPISFRKMHFRLAVKESNNFPSAYRGKVNLREMLQAVMNEYDGVILPTPKLSHFQRPDSISTFLFRMPKTSEQKIPLTLEQFPPVTTTDSYLQAKDRNSTLDSIAHFYISDYSGMAIEVLRNSQNAEKTKYDKKQIIKSFDKNKRVEVDSDDENSYIEGFIPLKHAKIIVGNQPLPELLQSNDEYEVKDMKNMPSMLNFVNEYMIRQGASSIEDPTAKSILKKIPADLNITDFIGSVDILHEVADGFSAGLRLALNLDWNNSKSYDENIFLFLECNNSWNFSLCLTLSHEANTKWCTFYGWAGVNMYKMNAVAKLLNLEHPDSANEIYRGIFPNFEIGFGINFHLISNSYIKIGTTSEMNFHFGKSVDVAKNLEQGFDKVITHLVINPNSFRVAFGLFIETVLPSKPKAIASPLGLR
mgnify:CR=1 FL=1